MSDYILELPWPPIELSPNTRLHWAKKAKAVKAYRHACFWLCKARGCPKLPSGTLSTSLTFHTPTARQIDADNALSRMKAGIDGVSEALGINDKRLRPITVDFGEPIKGGKVILTIKTQ